ncbi:MAG: NorD protein [Bacteroidetes bacterium]|nr:NorD protein [Bacteroidota bacterium]
MALDEYLFGKAANYFKKNKKVSAEILERTVYLNDIKQRLIILSRAITGEAIEIFPAEREGGFKENNFFMPSSCALFSELNQNISFYFFRTLYLSTQKKLKLNWYGLEELPIQDAQKFAAENAPKILSQLFEEFPVTKEIYLELKIQLQQSTTSNKQPELSWLYGKWMRDTILKKEKNNLKNIGDQTKTIEAHKTPTVIKANAVEEVITIEVDKKQQEEYVFTHNFEKVETADEFSGVWRDFDGDDELEKQANALNELKMKYTVRVDEMAHSVYQADFTENTNISYSEENETNGHHYAYDEWDQSKQSYKKLFCKVYPYSPANTAVSYYQETLKKYSSTLSGLRKMMTHVNNKMQQQRRQVQGNEFEIDAVTDLYADVHSGHTPSEKIYLSNRKIEKDLSILILLDISLSSDGYANGNRVIDVEKQVSILFGEILYEFNIDFAITSFYSKTRNHSSYLSLKGFEEGWNTAKHKIGAIEPCGYTRIGAALRHSGALLDHRDSKNKWVILISDGKPNDYDKYEGNYGIQDVKQALRELNMRQINSYALAIEAEAKFYLPQMFGQNHYQILTTPVELLQALVKLYEKIKHQS